MRRLGKCLLYILASFGGGVIIGGVFLYLYRQEAAEYAVGRVLRDAGVVVNQLQITEVSGGMVVAECLDGEWRGQKVHVDRVTIDRSKAEPLALGDVAVSGIRVELDMSKLSGGAVQSTPETGAGKGSPEVAGASDVQPSSMSIPFGRLSAQGTVKVGGLPGLETLEFRFEAQPSGGIAKLGFEIKAEGLSLRGGGRMPLEGGDVHFEVVEGDVDLGRSWPALQGFAGTAMDGLVPGGRLGFSLKGSTEGGRLQVSSRVSLRELSLCQTESGLKAEGISGELELVDALLIRSAAGQRLSIRKVSVGGVDVSDILLQYQLVGDGTVRLEALGARAFGGRVALDPIEVKAGQKQFDVSVAMEGIEINQLLALFPEAKAKATGFADGRVPLSYGPKGFDFGRGWVGMSARGPVTLKLDHPGLLTSGMAPSGTAYSILKQVEEGMLNLKVEEFRADLFPAKLETERSVELHIAGVPLDPNVKAPVSIDVNVNGPLAALINWSMDSRVKFGGQKH